MSSTLNYFSDNARLSDTDDGVVLAVDIGKTRIPASAWHLTKKLAAAGNDGLPSGAVSVTDRDILEGVGLPIRTNPAGTRVYLDKQPIASSFVIHVPPGAPKRAGQHESGGAPIKYVGPRFGR